MATDKTIGGITLTSFAHQPTPRELAAIVADWHPAFQADFIQYLSRESMAWDDRDEQLLDIARMLAQPVYAAWAPDFIRDLSEQISTVI